MRKFMTWLATLLIYTMHSPAMPVLFTFPKCDLDLVAGYRHDNFKWNIAGCNDSPDELWEVKFSDMQLWQVGGTYSYTTCNNYYIRFSGDYAKIVSGDSRARAWRLSRQQFEFSRIEGEGNRGRAFDIEAAIGYTFISNGRRFVGTPVLGYAWNYQYLRMHDLEQVLSRPDRLNFDFEHNVPTQDDECCPGCPNQGRLGDIQGLKSRYDPRWFGLFLGFDWQVIVEPCFLVYGNVEWHINVQYRANGQWHLQHRQLLNFSHHSNGHGLTLNLGGSYDIGNGWFIGIEGQYRNFQAGSGRHTTTKLLTSQPSDRIFGRMPFVKKSDFNRAKWNTYSIQLSLAYRYWCGA